jgi:hypothetical protein
MSSHEPMILSGNSNKANIDLAQRIALYRDAACDDDSVLDTKTLAGASGIRGALVVIMLLTAYCGRKNTLAGCASWEMLTGL